LEVPSYRRRHRKKKRVGPRLTVQNNRGKDQSRCGRKTKNNYTGLHINGNGFTQVTKGVNHGQNRRGGQREKPGKSRDKLLFAEAKVSTQFQKVKEPIVRKTNIEGKSRKKDQALCGKNSS